MSGAVCYSTQQQAIDAYFSSIVPTPTISFQHNGVDWTRVTYNSSGTAVSSIVAPLPALPWCNHLQPFQDGLAVGAALVGAIVVTSLIGLVSRAST